jgi:hypothetical protein
MQRRLGAEANQLFFSRALTSSEIRRRSPDAVTLARSTVTSTGPLPSSGKERALHLRFQQAVDLGEGHVDRHGRY